MWLCRIARPDIMIGVTQRAKHVTCWSLNDDKRIQRIVGYLKSISDYAHVMKISDSPSEPSLSLYCDANFGDLKDMKSTSGFVIAIEGSGSFAMLGWGSKKQKVVSRSTAESEFVSLSTALLQEAVPLLEVWQHLIPSIKLVIYEDNTASIAISQKGYSPKFRALNKTHWINVASTCELINQSGDIEIRHVDTDKQKADVMTKGLSVQKWSFALSMLQIVDKKLPDEAWCSHLKVGLLCLASCSIFRLSRMTVSQCDWRFGFELRSICSINVRTCLFVIATGNVCFPVKPPFVAWNLSWKLSLCQLISFTPLQYSD